MIRHDLTSKLVALGKGAHIFKIDISRAFCQLSIDPADNDLLGLYWDVGCIGGIH